MGVMLLADAKLSHVLWAGGSVLLLYVVCLISYRIVLHPLAKHPGPLLGKFSSLPLYLAIVQKNKTPMHYEMFKKYGSPFRITTNELIFADMKSWSDIYGQSSNPCLKDPGMYDLFTVTGERNLLNATNWSQHARLKRLLSFAFSLKSLLKSEPIFSARVEEYIRLVISESKRKPIDIYARTHEHYLDIVSQLSFGKSFDCLQGNTNALGDLKAFVTVIPATSFFPILKYLPIPAIREGFKRVARLEDFSRSTVKDFLRKHKDGDPSTKGSFLENLITAEDSETGAKLSMDELVENTIIFLVGGSGTTAAATVWFIWECSRNPNAKGKLLDEIRRAFPDPKVRPTYEQTSNLVSGIFFQLCTSDRGSSPKLMERPTAVPASND